LDGPGSSRGCVTCLTRSVEEGKVSAKREKSRKRILRGMEAMAMAETELGERRENGQGGQKGSDGERFCKVLWWIGREVVLI